MTAQQKLQDRINKNFHICVGLDTDTAKIPPHLLRSSNPVLEFNKVIIENTFREAAAYKINFAFYEKDGLSGIENLIKTREMIPGDLLVIGDAKRGDIGNTSSMYAKFIYDELKFDAVTLHPYMGYDSVQPFLDYGEKLNFILGLTSNKSSNDFEKLELAGGKLLYMKVIEKINEWNSNKNCGIVYGATNLEDLKNDVSLFGDLPVLLPGVGIQGGSLEDVTKLFVENGRNNFIINISRALIYADDTLQFGQVVKNYITTHSEAIQKIIEHN